MEASELYALAMYSLTVTGLALGFWRSSTGWRLQVGSLVALTALWAIALGLFLTDDTIGHDCMQADHAGELPALVATLVWAGVLLVAFTKTDPPVSSVALRAGLPVLTLAVIGGTVFVIWRLQSGGC